jgi:O-antigen/teichoic acid export membrane protein
MSASSPVSVEVSTASFVTRLRSTVFSDVRYRGVATAVLTGGAARALASALTLISLPLALRYLGAERYGIWATVASVSVWINLLDLGIANSLTNLVARAYAQGSQKAAARAFSNALALTCAAAVAAGCIFVFIWQRVKWVELFNASPALWQEVRWTVLVAAFLMLAGLPLNLTGKVLAGYQELHIYNQSVAAGAVCNLAGLGLGIAERASMPVLFLFSFGGTSAVSCGLLLWLVLRHKPWMLPRRALLHRPTSSALLNSGWSFFLIQVAAVVVFSSDNIIVSHYLGAAQVTPYSVTWRLVGFAAVLQSLLFTALWPAYTEAHARGDVGWIRRTYRKTMQTTLALNFGCALVLVCVGRPLIRHWAGAAAVPSRPLLLAMACWSVVGGLTMVQSCLLAALNRTRAQALLSVIACCVNLTISILLVTRIGSLGVILGTLVSYLTVLVIPQTLIVSRALNALSAECGRDHRRSSGRIFRSRVVSSP